MILLRHGQSHFNVVFSTTRWDPGYVDPGLTSVGREQAAAAAESLGAYDIARIVASPYARTLETAEIIAGVLALSVSIEPIIRERAFFRCDIGSPRSDLSRRWPRFDFADLPERWWPEPNAPLLDFIPITTNKMIRLHHVVVRDYRVEGKIRHCFFGSYQRITVSSVSASAASQPI